MNTTEEEQFDYQAYMKEHTPDLGEIHRGPEARQKRREAAILNNRGLDYRDEGDYDRAIEDFNKALELKPDYAEPYTNRGNAYSCKEDYDRAIEDYDKAIELNPKLTKPYSNRGVAYVKKGEFERAVVDCTKAIKLKPDYADAYYNRSEAWLHLGEWEKARADLMTAENMEIDIIAAFGKDYESVPDFAQKTGVQLPADIAAMLTPTQA